MNQQHICLRRDAQRDVSAAARSAGDGMRLLAEQPVVVRTGSDPEPYERFCPFDREGAVVSPDPSCQKRPTFLK